MERVLKNADFRILSNFLAFFSNFFLNIEKFYKYYLKPDKLVVEPLNFADDMVRSGNCQKRAVFKNWSDALSINLD